MYDPVILPVPPAPPSPAAPAVDLTPLVDHLALLQKRIILLELDHAEILKQQAALQASMDVLVSRPLPVYRGGFLGWTIVLRPQP